MANLQRCNFCGEWLDVAGDHAGDHACHAMLVAVSKEWDEDWLAGQREHCRSLEAKRIWTDGPDSEAARAYRGKGSLSDADIGHLRDENARLSELLTANGIDPMAPDPDYTPAVRRVVAWETNGLVCKSAEAAYQVAALAVVRDLRRDSAIRFLRRLRMMRADGKSRLQYETRVRNRLASLLRHWDENMGTARRRL